MLPFGCQTDPGRARHELQAWRNLSQKHERSWKGEHRGAGLEGTLAFAAAGLSSPAGAWAGELQDCAGHGPKSRGQG